MAEDRAYRAVVLVSKGFDLKSGYYFRAIRDCETITQLNADCTIVNVSRLFSGGLRGARETMGTIALADLIVIENYGALVVSLLLACLRRAPEQRRVFVVHGSLAELSVFSWGRLKSAVYKAGERLALHQVDFVFCVSEVMAEDMRAEYPAAADKIMCSPNSPSAGFLSILRDRAAIERSALRSALGLPTDATILLYVGNSQTWQRLDVLGSLAHHLTVLDDRVYLVCVTADVASVMALMSSSGVPPDRLVVRSASQEEIPGYLMAADWHYVLRETNEINRVACPTKAVEYLHAKGYLIVSPCLGDITRIVEETGLGRVLRNVDRAPEAAASELLRVWGEQGHQSRMSGRQTNLPETLFPEYNRSLFGSAMPTRDG